MPTNRLVLIDGNNLLYSYATTMNMWHDDMQVGGIHGFIQACHKILDSFNPRDFAIVFDGEAITFRHELWPEYKANRGPKKVLELVPNIHVQKHLLKKICRSFGWLVIVPKELEADDVIGCLAKSYKGECFIVSKDKDFCQLVSSKIKVGFGTDISAYFTPEMVKKKYGILPEKFVEYLMMIGDSADNVPGIRGVQHKTAVKYFGAYGSLRNLYDCAEDLSKKAHDNLITAAKMFKITKKLLTIVTDAEKYQCNNVDTTIHHPDYEKLGGMLKSCGIHPGRYIKNYVSKVSLPEKAKKKQQNIEIPKRIVKPWHVVPKLPSKFNR